MVFGVIIYRKLLLGKIFFEGVMEINIVEFFFRELSFDFFGVVNVNVTLFFFKDGTISIKKKKSLLINILDYVLSYLVV